MLKEPLNLLGINSQNFGCLGLLLPFLRFLREQHRWIDRYLPDQRSYWRGIGNELINKWNSGELDLSQYGPEELSRLIELSLKFSDIDLEKRQRFGIAAVWQMLNQKASLGENFESYIRTGNESYKKVERLGPVAEIIFKDRNPKLAEAFVFGLGDLEQVFKADEKLFQFLEKYLLFIRFLYQDSKSQDYTRKVNEGLYLRHILRTMILADEFYRQLKEKGVELNYEVLMMAAALHDAIEVNKEYGREISVEYLQQRLQEIGFEEKDAYNISHMVSFLMPQQKTPVCLILNKKDGILKEFGKEKV